MRELDRILDPVPPNKPAARARASTRGADCSSQDGKPSLQFKETTLLAPEISVISKEDEKKTQYLGMVRDESEKQLASRYWTC